MSKLVVLGVLLASSPLCLVAVQDPARTGLQRELAALRGEIARLQAEVAGARQQLDGARGEAGEARRQLEECLDLLQPRDAEPPRRRNCTPSRGSLTWYQWLDRNGHPQRAQSMLERVAAEHGDDPRRLAGVASDLMHGEETAGRFDRAALALAQRALQRDGDPDHHTLDVAALAHFLNGHIEQAIGFGRRAAAAANHGEYRARLRMYEAALRHAGRPAATESAAGGD